MPKWRNFTRPKKPLKWPERGQFGYTIQYDIDTLAADRRYQRIWRRRNDADCAAHMREAARTQAPIGNTIIQELAVYRIDVASYLQSYSRERQGVWIYSATPFTEADLPVIYEE